VKFLRLLLTNVFRNRRRSILTVTSIAVSLFLVATLLTVLSELEDPLQTPASALRLICRHRVSMTNFLPKAHRLKISQVEGVESVIGSVWFGGVYKDPKNFFAQFAVDVDQFFEIYRDLSLAPEQRAVFLQDRTGAIVGEKLAAKYGWQQGDRITLRGARFEFDPELTIRGIYSGGGDDGSILYFHWDYFNEAVKDSVGPWADSAGFYIIKARSAEVVPQIAAAVDAGFRDTSAPTKTECEQAFVLGHVAMIGNVRLLVAGVSSAVIFTVVLLAANSMAMSIRERAREIGILKALGFRRSQVLALLLGESVALSMSGALIGSLGARFVYANLRMATVSIGMIQRFVVTPGTLVACAATGLLVGLIAAGIPAWRAANRPVVTALREV
jgi:putative ABC transport system permease protein